MLGIPKMAAGVCFRIMDHYPGTREAHTSESTDSRLSRIPVSRSDAGIWSVPSRFPEAQADSAVLGQRGRKWVPGVTWDTLIPWDLPPHSLLPAALVPAHPSHPSTSRKPHVCQQSQPRAGPRMDLETWRIPVPAFPRLQ